MRLFRIGNNWKNVLYIHTPFCLQKCSYCVYPSTSKFTQKDISNFYEVILPSQIKSYKLLFQNAIIDEVYFGGGTPTIANADKLEAIYIQIPNFRNIPIKSTEASPFTLTDEHIALFHKYKFSYVSLGVQSLSRKILTKNNRLLVTRERLKEICGKLDRTGVIYNLDLICYLDKGDERDIAQFRGDLEYVLKELKPVSITVHSNHIAKPSRIKTRALLCLIKDCLGVHSEYKCVNSLLRIQDVSNDMLLNAEYKLLRKSFGFFNYLWDKYPAMPPYGYNVIALGSNRKFDIFVNSNVGVCGFSPKTNRVLPIPIDPRKKIISDSIRKKLGLPYYSRSQFFFDGEDKKKFTNLFIEKLTDLKDISAGLKYMKLAF